MSSELFDRHRGLLDLAIAATATRGAFSAYPDRFADFNEVVQAEGREAFENYCGSYFYLDQPGVGERVGSEQSPFRIELGIQYPKTNLNSIMPAAVRAREAWSRVDVDTRTGMCMEILHQLHLRSFEIGYATMHTTGQPFGMAFQSGGPHAQERGLEAVAVAYQEMKSIPVEALWEKGEGSSTVRLNKTFRLVGRGVGLVLGCATSPNWNAYPGIFANLMTGNSVIVKPHANSILPLAITVGVARHFLKEAGFDPNLVMLVVDEPEKPIAQALAARPEVKIIDYTGGPEFVDWLRENVRDKLAYVEGSAVNPVVIDSTANFTGMLRNLMLSASMFAGRMCTSPRVVFTSREGVSTPAGTLTTVEFDEHLTQAFERMLNDVPRSCEFLGMMRPFEYDARIEGAAALGDVVVESKTLEHPQFPGAEVRTPLFVRVRADQTDVYMHEWFGPIVFLVECETTAESLTRAAMVAREKGAISAMLYSTDAGTCAAAEEAFGATGTTLCLNFTGPVYMNQSAAFSDFHVSGLNPSGNGTLVDSAFVAQRFRVLETKSMA
jgi:phenylacetic acid degradation protein paaN